jgi:hypothetical protein
LKETRKEGRTEGRKVIKEGRKEGGGGRKGKEGKERSAY